MTKPITDMLGAAAETIRQLVHECRKGGPLYARDAKAVAQVSRTAKWLLNAIGALRRELDDPNTDASVQKR
jgi:hypothetical protein